MSDRLVNRLIQTMTETLLDHRWPEPGPGNNCSCGGVGLGQSIPEHQARVVLDALGDENFAVVELPVAVRLTHGTKLTLKSRTGRVVLLYGVE